MKTTVDIPEPLLEQAKRVAAQRSTTLRELVEAGLRHVIREQRRSGTFVLRDVRVGGRGLQPEFRGANWAQVRDAIYEGPGT
jgi:hypothetical protein